MSFWKKLFSTSPAPGAGSGRGGAMGTPSLTPDEAPPSPDQEGDAVVSGGGVADPEDDEAPAH